MNDSGQYWRVTQTLVLIASLCLVFAFFKWSQAILAPFLLALALTIILNPVIDWFQRKHIPRIFSILFGFVLAALPLVLMASYIGREFASFINNLDEIQQGFEVWSKSVSDWLVAHHITSSERNWHSLLLDSNVMNVMKQVLIETGSQLSNYLLIFFLVLFMLFESQGFTNKLKRLGKKKHGGEIQELKSKVTKYFLIKVFTSFVTGVIVFILLWAYGIEYALLFAALTFFLNFIPVVGSIISAIPPILFAFANHSLTTALSLIVWYLVIENIIGNIIEPKLMGEKLGVSTLVVFLSMSFWGFILGPAGIVLSTPLTICLIYFFNNFPQTKWVGVLLSDDKKESS